MEPRDPASQAPILVAFNPEAGDREPVDFGIAASAFIGAPLAIAAVFRGGPAVERAAGTAEHREQRQSRTLEHLRLDLERRGITADIHAVESMSVGVGLTQAIHDLAPQLVVLGATSRGAAKSALLGTTIERVIQHAVGPVAVVPRGYQRPANGIRTVGAAYAPTVEGAAAVRVAAGLARVGSAQLRAIQVLDPKHAQQQAGGMLADQHHEVGAEESTAARKRLRDRAELETLVESVTTGIDVDVDTLYNDPADGLLAAAHQVDLLVMGSRARGGRRAMVLGSVSRKVAERATCPVVIIPKGFGEAADDVVSHAAAHSAES
jgi:nucleotide-binding universal stress UspA family protein